MSDLTDNQFYPNAERIWLCIRLNKAGEILQFFLNHGNVAKSVQKLCTNFGRREAPSAPYVRCEKSEGNWHPDR